MSIKEQVRKAASDFVVRAELASYERAKVGRKNDDGGVSISVPKRTDFIYVTKSDSTVTIALNRGTVPLQYGLPIKMRVEAGIYVVQGRDRVREAPGTGDDNDYGVNPHDLNTHTDVVITSPADDQFLRYNGTNWVNETVVTDVGAAIHGATEKTTPVDADTMPLIDSAASNALKKVTWANIKATLKTYFDTLYELAGAIATHAALTVTHGATGAIVGTTNAQTLTNKTLDSTNISTLTAKNPPIDADSAVIVDSAASNVLKRVTYTNIKAFLKTYFDTLYTAINTAVLLTGDQTVAGIKTFSSRIAGSILRAADGNGVRIEDDAGNLGIIVHDGGRVTIGSATAGELLEVQGTGAAQAIRVKTLSAHAAFLEANSDNDALRMRVQANVTSGFFGTVTNHDVGIVTNSTTKATVTAGGLMGIGTTSPQGIFHAHNGTGGWLQVTKTGINATAQVVIPNGTGDVLYAAHCHYIVRASSGVVQQGDTFFVAGTPGTETNIYSDGGTNVVMFRINADGSADVRRTAGSLTYIANLFIQWL